ncbi:MAG: response regulator transcription factor [Pseudomonas sp.]
MRAFVIEDNPRVREGLVGTLRELAWAEAVGQAETEQEGVHWLAENPDGWDVVVVDLFLKEGSGMRILEVCRERRPSQKVVVVSNHATQDIRWRCERLGADAVFDKVGELDDLVDFCLRYRRHGGVPAAEGAPAGARHREPTARRRQTPARPP